MFGSGVGIFMELIPQEIKIIPMEQKVVPFVFSVAVAGTIMPAIALFPIVAATVLPSATAALASAFVGFPLINFCFFPFLPFANEEQKQEMNEVNDEWGCRGTCPPAKIFWIR